MNHNCPRCGEEYRYDGDYLHCCGEVFGSDTSDTFSKAYSDWWEYAYPLWLFEASRGL